MAIFKRSKMIASLLKEEIGLSGYIKLLDGNDFVLFLRFCFFCSLTTSGKISVSVFAVFAWVAYGLLSDDLNYSNEAPENRGREACGIFSLSTMPDCSFEFLKINFATWQTDQEVAIARLANAFIAVGDGIHRSMLRSITLSRAWFCAIFIRIFVKKWNDAVFKPNFAYSKPIWNAPKSSFFATFDAAFFSTTYVVVSHFFEGHLSHYCALASNVEDFDDDFWRCRCRILFLNP